MKLFHTVFAATLLACSAVCFSAHAGAPQKMSQKIYVESKNITLGEKGILITTSGGTFSIKTLRTDEKGIYFLRNDIRISTESTPKEKRIWKCPCCGQIFETNGELIAHSRETGHREGACTRR